MRAIRIITLIALPSFFWGGSVQAIELTNDLQIHGFASQAFLLSSENNFFGDSDGNGSFDFRELGLNASWRPVPNLLLSAQMISRRAGESDDGDLRLDYGLFDYSLISSEAGRLGLRFGRIKNPYGLYNETRDVPSTRPSILLPQSIYFDRSRSLAQSGDGALAYGELWTESGDILFHFGAGNPVLGDRESETAFLTRDFPGELEDDLSYIGRVLYERDGGRVRLALSAVEANIDYDPGASFPNDLLAGSLRLQPRALSAQYNAQHWSLTAEYAQIKVQTKGLGIIPDQRLTGESYYLQAAYRFNDKWQALVRYDVLYADEDDRDGEAFAQATGLPAHNRFAKDLTVGLSWNITPSFMLRAEYHNVNGTGWLTALDNPNISEIEQHWDLFILQASYQF